MRNVPPWLRGLLLGGVLLLIILGAIFWIINSRGPLATVVSVVFIALGLIFSLLQTFPLSKFPSHQSQLTPPSITVHLSSPLAPDEQHLHIPLPAPVSKIEHNDTVTEHVEDWGEAPYLEHFYGRGEELAQLTRWVLTDSCHVLAILGMGGLGKTALTTHFARQVKHSFEYVFWRSLQNAPSFETMCRQFLANLHMQELPNTLDEQLSLLLASFRKHRCLLILDNFESILQQGRIAGEYQAGYEGYGQFVQRVGMSQHRSCLLITSREKPREFARMEGTLSPVHTLSIRGVDTTEGQVLLQSLMLFGSGEVQKQLIALYSGNVLALKLIAETIREVFGGDIARFLQQKETVFGDISTLLTQQFARLSPIEQNVLYVLAIGREPLSLEELQESFLAQKSTLLEALASLRRRSMIEIQDRVHFTLQPVIVEYLTDTLVQQAYDEIQAEAFVLLKNFPLLKARAKDYIRDSQLRFLLAPLGDRLIATLGTEGTHQKLQAVLSRLHAFPEHATSYEAGNILNLLVALHFDISQYDFSSLTVREAYLREASHVNFAHAHLINPVFTDTFSGILSVAFNPDGTLFATATAHGEIPLWQTSSGKLFQVLQGHCDAVWSIAFSPDGSSLASGSQDSTIRVWDIATGHCQRTIYAYDARVWSVAFHSDGAVLASGSEDSRIRLWEVATGTGACIQTVHSHIHRILSLAFNGTGTLLASGSEDQTIALWEIGAGRIQRCLSTLQGHTACVRAVCFSPDGSLLASGSEDCTVRMWNVQDGKCLRVLHGHTAFVRTVAFDTSGNMVASGGEDCTVRLWNVATGQCITTLQRHTNRIWSVAFSPVEALLASGSDDQTVQVWDISAERSLYTLRGHQIWVWSVAYTQDGNLLSTSDPSVHLWESHTHQLVRSFLRHINCVRSVAVSPDGKHFASASEDSTLSVWEISTGHRVSTLHGHTDYVRAVAFSPDGNYLISGGDDSTIRLWDVRDGTCLCIIQEHTRELRAVAFSPDGQFFATTGDDETVRLWDSTSRRSLATLQGYTARVRSLAFHPQMPLLVSGSADQSVRIWDIQARKCARILRNTSHGIRATTFSPNSLLLASGGDDEIVYLYKIENWQAPPLLLQGHEARIRSLSFSPDGLEIVSGSDDGTIRFWDCATGSCKHIIRSSRPYDGMNIAGVKGLNEAQLASLKTLGAIEG